MQIILILKNIIEITDSYSGPGSMSMGGSMKVNNNSASQKLGGTLASREGPRKSVVEESKIRAMDSGIPSYGSSLYTQQQ